MKKFKFKLISCLISLFLILPAISYAQNLNEEWVARYSSPGNYPDYPMAIAVDNSGNTYVTGYSYSPEARFDYATIKYDANGNQLWAAGYNGPGNYYDYALAIAVDDSGNAYVTGSSRGTTNYDYATVKYDTNGNQLWVARYNGPGNDSARDITLDALGNVYVTGYSWGSGTSNDFATVKYDTNGNQLWVARYNGPGNDSDNASAIAVDASGNVYITGDCNVGASYDYATIKYDTNGNEQWVSRYNGPGNLDDYTRDIAVDALGNVYVAGYSWGSGTFYDYATVKYDTNGNEQWARRYDGPDNDYDYVRNFAVDASGSVYVTGYSWGVTRYDYATVKYDTNGNEQWVRRYNGPGNNSDYATAVAVDASGNAYVTGYGWGARSDYITIKYDTNGNEVALASYNSPYNYDDSAIAIAVDDSGNAYVTGYSVGSGTNNDFATVKYSSCNSQGVTGSVSSIETLWPPNHEMVAVTINTSLTTHNPDTTISITSVDITESSNRTASENYGENVSDPNNFEPDVEITGNLTLNLRAERTGASSGRTYIITVTATDCSGSYNFTTEVAVPHDQGS